MELAAPHLFGPLVVCVGPAGKLDLLLNGLTLLRSHQSLELLVINRKTCTGVQHRSGDQPEDRLGTPAGSFDVWVIEGVLALLLTSELKSGNQLP